MSKQEQQLQQQQQEQQEQQQHQAGKPGNNGRAGREGNGKEEVSTKFKGGVRISGKGNKFRSKNGKTEINSQINSNFKLDKKSNDPSWYTLTPSLLMTGANISFNSALGAADVINMVHGASDVGDNYQDNFSLILPGILTIDMVPTVGVANNPASPINLAAKSIFTNIRRSINGSRPYEAVDVMNYLLAVGSIYPMIAYLHRALGATNHVSLLNRYSRRALIVAMGIDYEDLISNIADYTFAINILAQQVNHLPIPQGIPLFTRWMWLNTNVFMDDKGPKAQYIIPRLSEYYQYEYQTEVPMGEGPVRLVVNNIISPTHVGNPNLPTDETDKGVKISEILKELHKQVSALIQDTDISIIAGDIIKTYDQRLATLPLLNGVPVLTPRYDEEFSSQLHNMHCSPVTLETIVTKAEAKNGESYLYTNFSEVQQTAYPAGNKTILDLPFEQPKPIDNMIASRLISVFERDPNGGKIKIKGVGSELPHHIRVWNYSIDASDNSLRLMSHPIDQYTPVNNNTNDWVASDFDKVMTATSLLSKFKEAPYLYVVTTTNGLQALKYQFIGDVRTYAYVDNAIIANMHEAALFSLLGIGEINSGVLQSSARK